MGFKVTRVALIVLSYFYATDVFCKMHFMYMSVVPLYS